MRDIISAEEIYTWLETSKIRKDMTLTVLWSASCLSLSMAERLMRGGQTYGFL